MTNDRRNMDPGAGERAKQEGMSNVDRGANPVWKEMMEKIVRDMARHHRQFSTDAAYRVYYAIPDNQRPNTRDQRSMGPLMLRLAKEGVCVKADVPAVPSDRASLHRSPLQIWNSLIYEGPEAPWFKW
jgi:hypothetical protein